MAVDGVEKHAAKKGPDVLRTSLRALEKAKSIDSLIQSFIHSLIHSFDTIQFIQNPITQFIDSFHSFH